MSRCWRREDSLEGGEGGEEDAVVEGGEGEVKEDEVVIKVASILTWSLWLGTGALGEVGIGEKVAKKVTGVAGTGGMVAKKVKGEVGKEGTLLEVREAVVKNEMGTEDTPGMEEVLTGPGAKAG